MIENVLRALETVRGVAQVQFVHRSAGGKVIDGIVAAAGGVDEPIVTDSTPDQVVAGAALDDVVAAVTAKRVGVLAALEEVVVIAAPEGVAALRAEQQVAAGGAEQSIAARAGERRIVGFAAVEKIIAGIARARKKRPLPIFTGRGSSRRGSQPQITKSVVVSIAFVTPTIDT